jgi:hypothetical protein
MPKSPPLDLTNLLDEREKKKKGHWVRKEVKERKKKYKTRWWWLRIRGQLT